MPTFITEKVQPETISHWGQFFTRRRRVRLDMIDHGLVGDKLVSEFTCEGTTVISRTPVSAKKDRLFYDYVVLRDMGIDPDSFSQIA